MATKYDPVVIQKLADQLYSQANSVVATWTILLLLIGGATGFALGSQNSSHNGIVVGGIGAAVGAFFGFAIGQSRAFVLRVQAQTALCQKQIEENTRRR